jgi:vitamin B12 transporter
MFSKCWICASALAASVSVTWAASLGGTVTDAQAKPVPGAAITLISAASDLRWSAASGDAGLYRFDNLPAGNYLLRVDAAGFATFLLNEIHLDASSAATQDAALQIAGLREQVVVTASSTPQAAAEVSKTMTVIDQSETENRDAPDLANAVDLAPGVRVQQLGGPGAYSQIQIRGLRPEDTAVLVDGLRLRDAAAPQADATGLIEDFTLADTSQIEVLRGPGSSLYGTNAMGGVVNVITDEGGGRTRGSVLMEGGSLGMFRGRAQIAGAGHNDHIQYSLGTTELYVASGIGGDLPYRDTSVHGSVGFLLSPTTRLILRLYGVNSFGKLADDPNVIGTPPGTGILPAIPNVTFLPAPDDPDYTRAARYFTGALTLTGQPSAPLSYSISYQDVDSSRRYGDGPAGVGYQPPGTQRELYDGRIETINAHADYRLGSHNLLTAGYEFETENFAYDYVDDTNALAASAINVTQRSQALFAQDQIRLLDGRLQISAGFRAQFFALETPEFLPSASAYGGAPYQGISFPAPPPAYTGDGSVAYLLRRSGTRLRAHVGRGYRAPSLYERFGAGWDPTFGYSVYGDPRLRPELFLGFDTGVEQTFAHARAKVSATYFYTWLQEVITFDTINAATDPFGRSIGYINTQGGISRGVELAASFAPARLLTISTAYTFVNAAERVPIVGDTIQTFVIPRNQFSLLATARLTPRLLMTFESLLSGSYVAPIYGTTVTQVYRFNGLDRLNLGASYRIPLAESRAVRLFARGENLLDQAYFESGFPTPGLTARAGAQFEF